MNRNVNCYHMPRRLSQYGPAFIVEELPEKKGSVFFIEKPDWCNPFESIHPNVSEVGAIYNIKVRDKLYCSIDGIIAMNALHNKGERADEYRDLESQLSDLQVEIEHAMHEGRWMKWMKDNVEAIEKEKDE